MINVFCDIFYFEMEHYLPKYMLKIRVFHSYFAYNSHQSNRYNEKKTKGRMSNEKYFIEKNIHFIQIKPILLKVLSIFYRNLDKCSRKRYKEIVLIISSLKHPLQDEVSPILGQQKLHHWGKEMGNFIQYFDLRIMTNAYFDLQIL